ncbi:hypothetical protein ACFV1W_20995 [Kitasatospora sp. NPDC059648]|uniref:hypothetical protein n=1 Tax=Kitasatospora sp. NPDC059648 TaxID=3346894 RepID=UPI0036AC47E8
MSQEEFEPIHFGRRFYVQSYQVSHRKLVMRSAPEPRTDPVDVIFDDVLGMKVRSSYRELHITNSGDPVEVDDFLDLPQRYSLGYTNLTVSDGKTTGFVVCRRLRVRPAGLDDERENASS